MISENMNVVNNKPSETLDEKVNRVFGRVAIDKRRLPLSQLQKRGIPAYVGEWLLDSVVPGIGELSGDDVIKVQNWSEKYIPRPDETNIIKNRLLNGEIVKILTSLQVEVVLTKVKKERVAKLSLLGLKDAYITDDLVKAYPDLLKQGMWGVVELVNVKDEIVINSFKPLQATVNLKLFKEARKEFNLQEWIALILTSMGYDSQAFSDEEQKLLIYRLLPLVQKNMHMMELAPKGTGKSYVYENISSHVRLISGGNISPAVLFVNNQSGQWGLLARYSVVVLDEVQTLKFEKPEEIIGGLKGYLANGNLTRGGLHESASDCGLVLLANISLDSQQNPIADPLVKELPDFLQETAFLDRIRALIPGWKLRKLGSDCFAKGVGLKSDFFGDALLAFRNDLEIDQMCTKRIHLKGSKPYKRNEDAVRFIASGLMKILFPHGEVSVLEFEHYCVRPAKMLRQNIWKQLQALDAEYRQYESEIDYEILPD
jgi:ATP-dependent Lon protease